jgi:hypothetical protein
MKPDYRNLGIALLAAAVVTLGIAFIGGCFYPFLDRFWILPSVATPRPAHHDIDAGVSFELGILTAMIALPVIAVLAFGVGFPLFRHWVHRGYSNVVVYIGGGIIVAGIGAGLISVAHLLADVLARDDFVFAMLLLSISGPISGLVVWSVLKRAGRQSASG